MKKLIKKDKNKRIIALKYENLRFILKNISQNTSFISPIRWNASAFLSELELNSNKIRLKNRCVFTSRKNTLANLKFSRLQLLKLVRTGYVYGVRKNS